MLLPPDIRIPGPVEPTSRTSRVAAGLAEFIPTLPLSAMRNLSVPLVLKLMVSLLGKLINVSVSPTCFIESEIKNS